LELKIRIASGSSDLIMCVESAAKSTGRPANPLQLQALLQLPRIADRNGFVPTVLAESFLRELANEIPVTEEWSVAAFVGKSPRSLHFQEILLDEGLEVMRRFHYLRSARLDGRIYGLRSETGRLVAVCVSSPLDVDRLTDLLQSEQRVTRTARVLSRVFVFEGAPSNTISYLLSRATRAERRLGITDWVTYVNPNMGFTGVSYLASNWHKIGDEPGTTYRYLDKRYITDRELAAKFGAHDDHTYRRFLGDRFAKSKMPLAPLLVFAQHFSKSPSMPD
jgi:hypothetical protein